MSAPRRHVTTGNASLIGGIVVAAATLVLWLAAARELGFHGNAVLALGAAVAAAAGIWTRLADL
jgi:large exoprotein involved in heme utilization and adhesion